jgi:hypothetical protein
VPLTKAEVDAIAADLTAAQIKVSKLVPDAVVTPPPVDPPPADKLVALLPSCKLHRQAFSQYKFDLVPQSKLAPREVPLNIPFVNDGGASIFAASKKGQPVTTWTCVPAWGAPTALYSEAPYFDPATGTSRPLNTEFSDDFATMVGYMKQNPMPLGKRGIAIPNGFGTYISHPHLFDAKNAPDKPTLWGTPIPFAPDGLFFWHNAQVGLAFKDHVQDAGFIPGIVHLHDACVDRTDRQYFYGCAIGPKVGTAYTGGRLVRIDRALGKGKNGVPEDATKYVVSDVVTGLTYPTAVTMDDSGNVYYVDAGTNQIWKKAPGAAAVVLTAACPYPFAMRYFVGYLYVMSRDNGVRLVNATTGSVGPNLMTATDLTGPFGLGVDFATISVDINGTCGPQGAFSVTRVHTHGNCNLWEFAPGGVSVKYGQQIVMPSMQGWNRAGWLKNVQEWFGHYLWLHEYHEFQAMKVTWGYADNWVHYVVADGPYPVAGEIPYQWVNHAMMVWKRAGLTTLTTTEGWSPFKGCSWDEIADMSLADGSPNFDGMRAFIAGGMITTTPRPELATGIDSVKVIGTIVINSLRHIREGKPLIDKWFAWAAANGLPATAPLDPIVNVGDTEYPVYWEVNQPVPGGPLSIGAYDVGSSAPRTQHPGGHPLPNTPPTDAIVVLFEGFPALETTKLGTMVAGEWYPATVRVPSNPAAPTRAVLIRG